MMPGGKGGANTKTGIQFENKTDLLSEIAKLPGYTVSGREISKNEVLVAINCHKHKLYTFLKENGVDDKKLVSSRLLPDEALYLPAQKKMLVIEKKFQGTPGSVDEKLQTCAFKKQQYTKLLEPIGVSVEYIYVLSDWFASPKYVDVLNYVTASGCKHYFNELPLDQLGL